MERKSFWHKYGWSIALVVMIGLMVLWRNTYTLTTEKVTQDERLNHVGVLLDNRRDDRGWNQAHKEGFDAAAKELGLTIHYREYIEAKDVQPMTEELINEGCREIFATSYEYGSELRKMVLKYPDIYFFHTSGIETMQNMSVYFGRIYQARYLSGMVAGMTTRTNHIGYIGAVPISEVYRGMNAFTLGVRSVNPEAQVHVRWTGTWHDPQKETQKFRKLLDEYPVDVVTYHQNSDTISTEADKRGIRSIGYHYNNVPYHNGNMITAAIWNWKPFYTSLLRYCIEGRFRSKSYYRGLNENVVQLAPVVRGVLNPQQQKLIDDAKERMATHKWDVFFGPVYDNQGNLRVRPNENISDDKLLSGMTWLVAGAEERKDD